MEKKIEIESYDMPLEERMVQDLNEGTSTHKHIESATCTEGKKAYVVSVYEYYYYLEEIDFEEYGSYDWIYDSEKLISQKTFRNESDAWEYFNNDKL